LAKSHFFFRFTADESLLSGKSHLYSFSRKQINFRLFKILFSRHDEELYNSRRRGGIIEMLDKNLVCSRSGCYALIYLLKQGAGINGYLTS
jgi:hypothetical protein